MGINIEGGKIAKSHRCLNRDSLDDMCQMTLHVSEVHLQTRRFVFQTLTIIVHIEDIRRAFTCTQGYSQPWFLCLSHEHDRKIGHGFLAFSQGPHAL